MNVPLLDLLPPDVLARLHTAAETLDLHDGQVLAEDDSPVRAAWLVQTGELRPEKTGAGVTGLPPATAGTLVDEAAVVLGGPHEACWRSHGHSSVLRLPLDVLHAAAIEHPQAWETLVDQVTTRMLAGALRSALQRALPGCDPAPLVARAFAEGRWWHMARGEPLFEAGDELDGWYVLVSGELAELGHARGRTSLLGTLHPGDLVGDSAALAAEPHATTVIARRDAWLLRLDAADFDEQVLRQPQTVHEVARRAVRRAQQPRRPVSLDATVAIIPVHGYPHLEQVVGDLSGQLRRLQPLEVLDAARCEALGIVRDLHQRPRADLAWLRLDAWIHAQHQRGRRVLLVGDSHDSAWSRHAALAADRIVLLADGDKAPASAPLAWMDGHGAQAPGAPPPGAWQPQHWLCLTHTAGCVRPRGTAAWLDALHPHRHLHLRLGHERDTARLARHLAGQAVGMALSGGGARGPAHAGIFHALEDAGIPVDFVAGTSAGSLMACLFAQDEGWARSAQRAIDGIGPPPGPFSDFTLPVVSLLKSQRLHDSVRDTYGDEQLEDSWIPCAVIATNLTRLRRVVFTRGPTWQAMLASISPPAVAKPRVIGGDLICDGGLIENMPVSVVVEHGCRHVLAANIASELTVSLQADDFPNPWRIMADRLLRGGRQTAGVPTAVEILLAATTLASEDARAAAADWQDLELSPDLGGFKSVDFKRSHELVDKAYADTTAALGVHRARHADAALWQLAHRFQGAPPNHQPEPDGETLP